MSNTYPHFTKTNFPDQVDRQITWRDPSATELPIVNLYNSYISSGQTASAVELLQANPSLQECIINADKLMQLHHSILSVQTYFYDFVLEKIFRIGHQKGDWNALMSSTAEDDAHRLDKYDVIKYPVDGVKQYFLVIGNNIEAGDIPLDNLDNEKYLQLSMKGDKGDTGDAGYTPIKGIDYNDGVDGIGMSPKGGWVSNREYYQYDLVSYDGFLWYCVEDNLNETPSDDSSIWIKMAIPMQTAVGSDMPTNLENGGLWMDLQEDGHVIIKTKSTDGTYSTLYPETKAEYIQDATGESLQRKIYQHYFERDDVKLSFVDEEPVFTCTATLLSNESIVVAKATLTDVVTDEAKQDVMEFTCYDDTGVYVMYKVKIVGTQTNGGKTYETVPEVLM